MDIDEKKISGFERHAQTLLTTLIALLLAGVAAFIFQIKDAQSEQMTEIRILQVQVANLNADLGQNGSHLKQEVVDVRGEIKRIESYQKTIWARLRAANENILILNRELQSISGKKIEMQQPDQF